MKKKRKDIKKRSAAARKAWRVRKQIQAVRKSLKQMEEKAETKPQITEEQNERST
jgi:hypothetical protein